MSSTRRVTLILLPGLDGSLAGVLFAIETADERQPDRFRPGALAGLLPAIRASRMPPTVALRTV